MEAGIITAIVGAFTAVGAGAWKLIDRADKIRERREIKVEELLKARVAALELAARRAETYVAKVISAAGKWREQLVAHQIAPEPAEWPEKEDKHE